MLRKVLPILAIVCAALIAIYSGAFTSITAERTATIEVAGDPTALLSIEAASPYVEYDEDGAVLLNLTAGVNNEAETNLGKLFVVTNNGTRDVRLTIYQRLDGIDVTETSPILFTYSPDGNPSHFMAIWNTKLAVGQSMDVYVKVYTNMDDKYPSDLGEIMDTIVFHAV
jgi:hypothetical protein